MIPIYQDGALGKCLVDIFSDGARWRVGIKSSTHDFYIS